MHYSRPLLPAAVPILTLAVAFSTIAAATQPATPGTLTGVGPDGDLLDLPLRQTIVSIEVTAFVARTTVEQRFVNPFDRPIDAIYTFPLGHEAAVDEFEMQSGDRVIRGEIHRREEAREIYEAARSQGSQAALLEQEQPNIFTQSVANLMPAGEVRVRIRTVELLKYDSGVYQLTFPLVVGPRYIPGEMLEAAAEPVNAVPNLRRTHPPTLSPGRRSGHDVEIRVALDAGVPLRNLTSVSHAIDIDQRGPTQAWVTLSPADRIPNKDFILRWSVASDDPAVGLLTHRVGVEGYFALIVQPRGIVDNEQAAPKEILFVLDTSGSMSGAPLRMSKEFIHDALRSLGSRDTFNLIQFAGGSSTFSRESLDGTQVNVNRALRWVDKLEGAGGTEMLKGLARAVGHDAGANRYRMIVFLTDGYIGNDDDILARARSLPEDVRLFTIGIGGSVNHSLLDGMARLGGGAYTFIPNDGDAPAALERFTGWVTRPYLTDLDIDWGALPVGDWIPEIPRDLFSGQNLTVVGHYFGAAEGSVVLRGRLGGSPWETEVPITLPEVEQLHGGLASIWARGRIQSLLDESPGQVSERNREEMIELALEHQLMSPFTSFVAVDYRVVNPGVESETIVQPIPLPDGTSFDRAVPLTEEIVERVQVVAARAVVDMERTSALSKFSDEFMTDLPVPGRFYQNVVAMAPGVQDADGDGAPNVHGARARDFKAVVSGVGNVDPLTGQYISRVNANSIEELEVITAGAGVEFSRAQGGFARIIQKQGSNQHEGIVTLEGGSDALDGVGGRDIPVSYDSARGGFQFSGPIARDRLWYRLSHEWIDRTDPLRIGADLVVVPQKSAGHSDQLTWQVSPRNKLQFRAQWLTDDVSNLGVSSFVRTETTPRIDRNDRTLAIGWVAPYSPRILVETVLSRRDTGFSRTPVGEPTSNGCLDPEDPYLGNVECLDLVVGAQSGTASRGIAADRRRYGLESKATIYGGRKWGAAHQLRLGVDFGHERYDRELTRDPDLARLSQEGAGTILARTSATLTSNSSAEARNWGLFVEDQIQPIQNLNFTLGLRLDSERIEGAAYSPFDPRSELERFIVDADGLTGDERIAFAGGAFTGPEDYQAFLDGVADMVGEERCCADPIIGPEQITSPRGSVWLQLDDLNLSPFFSIKWDPWANGRTAFTLAARRYFDRLLPAYALVETEPATAELIVPSSAGSAQPYLRPSIQLVDRALQTPYQDEWSVRFEREIVAETSLSVSFVHRSFERQIQQLDLNHRSGDFGRCVGGAEPGQPVIAPIDDPADPLYGIYPDGGDGVLDDCDADGLPDLYVQSPLWGGVFLLGNFGSGTYEGFTLELNRRQYRSWELRASYTFSKARGSGEAFDPLLGDERTLLENRAGFQSFDQRHVFKLHATVITRWGIRCGGSVALESGLPYSTLEYRVADDAIPPALAGLTESVPVPRLTYVTSTRNQARNDAFVNVDLRISKEYSVGRGVQLRWRIDVLNALNDRTYRIYPGERAYGRNINGFDDATSRFGRRFLVGLEVGF